MATAIPASKIILFIMMFLCIIDNLPTKIRIIFDTCAKMSRYYSIFFVLARALLFF